MELSTPLLSWTGVGLLFGLHSCQRSRVIQTSDGTHKSAKDAVSSLFFCSRNVITKIGILQRWFNANAEITTGLSVPHNLQTSAVKWMNCC